MTAPTTPQGDDAIPSWDEHNLHQRIKRRQVPQPDAMAGELRRLIEQRLTMYGMPVTDRRLFEFELEAVIRSRISEAEAAAELMGRIDELDKLDAQRISRKVESRLFPGRFMEVFEVPINLIWNRRDDLKRQARQATKGSE